MKFNAKLLCSFNQHLSKDCYRGIRTGTLTLDEFVCNIWYSNYKSEMDIPRVLRSHTKCKNRNVMDQCTNYRGRAQIQHATLIILSLAVKTDTACCHYG